MPATDLRDGAAVGTMDVTSVLGEAKRWRDILSAGQGVGSIRDTVPMAELAARLEREFHDGAERLGRMAARPPSSRAAA
jgi:nitronate monooxygenase